jgi:hypothetical protein
MYRFTEPAPHKADALRSAWEAAVKLARFALVTPGSVANPEESLREVDRQAEEAAEAFIDALQDVAGLAASSEVWGLATEVWSEPELLVARQAAQTARLLSDIMSQPIPDELTSRVPRMRLVVLEYLIAWKLGFGQSAPDANGSAEPDQGPGERIQ